MNILACIKYVWTCVKDSPSADTATNISVSMSLTANTHFMDEEMTILMSGKT